MPCRGPLLFDVEWLARSPCDGWSPTRASQVFLVACFKVYVNTKRPLFAALSNIFAIEDFGELLNAVQERRPPGRSHPACAVDSMPRISPKFPEYSSRE